MSFQKVVIVVSIGAAFLFAAVNRPTPGQTSDEDVKIARGPVQAADSPPVYPSASHGSSIPAQAALVQLSVLL